MNLWELITLILAAVIIVIGILMLTGVIKIFVSTEEQAAYAQFFGLAGKINEMATDGKPLEKDSQAGFYISDGLMIVAFDKGIAASKDACWNTESPPAHTFIELKHTILKPENYCGEGACLCLFSEQTDLEIPPAPEICVKIEADYIFGMNFKFLEGKYTGTKDEYLYKDILGGAKTLIGKDYPVYPQEIEDAYTDLYIFGECDGWSYFSQGGDATFGTHDLYLEKQLINDKVYILVMGKSAITERITTPTGEFVGHKTFTDARYEFMKGIAFERALKEADAIFVSATTSASWQKSAITYSWLYDNYPEKPLLDKLDWIAKSAESYEKANITESAAYQYDKYIGAFRSEGAAKKIEENFENLIHLGNACHFAVNKSLNFNANCGLALNLLIPNYPWLNETKKFESADYAKARDFIVSACRDKGNQIPECDNDLMRTLMAELPSKQ